MADEQVEVWRRLRGSNKVEIVGTFDRETAEDTVNVNNKACQCGSWIYFIHED